MGNSKLYCFIQISKIHTITLRARTLIATPRKSSLKSISSYIDRALKLCSFVLGTKTKRLCDQNFEIINFWKFQVGQKPLKMDFSNFQKLERSSNFVFCIKVLHPRMTWNRTAFHILCHFYYYFKVLMKSRTSRTSSPNNIFPVLYKSKTWLKPKNTLPGAT